MLRLIAFICCFSTLLNKSEAGFLHPFEGKPSLAKKCDAFWPKFNEKDQISQIFDKDWTRITLKSKGIQKAFFFNLIGIKQPKEIKNFNTDLSPLINHTKTLQLVPYRRDKQDKDHICHYAFRMRHEGQDYKTLVQIARIETMELAPQYDPGDLLIKDFEANLKNLALALPNLAPAIQNTVSAIMSSIALGKEGLPASQDIFQQDLNSIQTPLNEAVLSWTNFFDILLGTKEDSDWQIPGELANSMPNFSSTPELK